VAVKNSKILKVAGLSFVGFCAVSIGVDRANIGPVASQIAGFCGAFLGGWVGARRRRSGEALQNQLPVPEPNPAAVQSEPAKDEISGEVYISEKLHEDSPIERAPISANSISSS
jgi:hypothetical protein